MLASVPVSLMPTNGTDTPSHGGLAQALATTPIFIRRENVQKLDTVDS